MENSAFNSFMAFSFPLFSPFAGRIVVLLQEQDNIKKGHVVIEPTVVKSHLPCCWTPIKWIQEITKYSAYRKENWFQWINSWDFGGPYREHEIPGVGLKC